MALSAAPKARLVARSSHMVDAEAIAVAKAALTRLRMFRLSFAVISSPVP